MGEVYRARDPRLGRDVAVKVLPASFAEDADRLRRFQQEARAAGQLNHPNVLAVFDLGYHDNAPYLVSEMLEGETLRTVLSRGRLSVKRAVGFGIQLAQGLAAAHDRGIVHRDLKPENVFVTRDGRVKILDFGLAKLTQDELSAPPDPAASTATSQTGPGVVLGTVGYMSPEQLRGRPADARSDIFSLGAILYEMLAGRRAFQGASTADTLSAILREDPPDLSLANPAVPPTLERLVRHCLEKSPEARFGAAHDVAFDLDEISAPSGSGPVVGVRARAAATLRRIAAALALAALLALVFVIGRWQGEARNRSRQVMTFQPLTITSGDEWDPTLSPDGQMLAFAKHSAPGNADIFLLRVGGTNAINLTPDSPKGDEQPAFSPDGRLIAFRSEREGGGIFVMGATGESVRRLTDFGYGPAWTPDGGSIVLATGPGQALARPELSALWSVNVVTGEARKLYEGDGVQPAVSPHGRRIAFWALSPESSQRDIWTIPLPGLGKDERPVPVTADAPTDVSPFWSSDGRYVFFLSDRAGTFNLWRVRIDEGTGRVEGEPEPMTTPARDVVGRFWIAADGHHLAYRSLEYEFAIERVGFDPDAARVSGGPVTVLRGIQELWGLEVARDGSWIATATLPREDIAVISSDGATYRRLTDDTSKDRFPTFSPDGRQVAFQSDRGGRVEIWAIGTDGRGLRQLTRTSGGERPTIPRWSPDGKTIAVSVPGGAPRLLHITGGEIRTETLPDSPEHPIPKSWAPDGTRLACQGVFGGIWVYTLGAAGYERVAEAETGYIPSFLPDGHRLLYLDSGSKLNPEGTTLTLRLVDTVTKRSKAVLLSDETNLLNEVALSADGRSLFLLRNMGQSDIWMATLP
jgi:Tol biopolymer transport system component